MTAISQLQAKDLNTDSLEEMNALLSSDMKSVNALIMEHMQSPVALIPQLASYLIAAGGKRVRPLLTLASTQIYSGDMNRAAALAACVEFIHSATLLHDDVVDESAQRRGKDAANLIFGNQASVLVGDFLFARAFQLMTADGSLEILRILSDASATIAEGEVMQLTTASNLSTTMEQYIEVIHGKTAALFAAACEVGPVIANADNAAQKAMRDYGAALGIAFQIADDALDYMAEREKLGKSVGDDFREGKVTAPILFALEKANEEEQEFWNRTIGAREQKDGDLEKAQALLTQHNAIQKSLELAQNHANQAKYAIQNAPEHTLKIQLENLAVFVVNRSS